MILKAWTFQTKLETFPKFETTVRVFGYKNRGKYSIYLSNKCYEEKNVGLLSKGEEGKGQKGSMILSRILIP